MKRSLILAILMGGVILQQFTVHADDATLPGNGFPGSRYEVLWTKSPFSVASSEAASSSPDYALKGIAQFDGIYYASLVEKQNNEHFLLSTDKPVRGLKLVSVTPGKDPLNTSAVIDRNGQSITLKLEVTEMPPIPGGNTQSTLPPGAPPPEMAMPGGSNPNVKPPRPGEVQVPPPVISRPRLIHFNPPPTGIPGQPRPNSNNSP